MSPLALIFPEDVIAPVKVCVSSNESPNAELPSVVNNPLLYIFPLALISPDAVIFPVIISSLAFTYTPAIILWLAVICPVIILLVSKSVVVTLIAWLLLTKVSLK